MEGEDQPALRIRLDRSHQPDKKEKKLAMHLVQPTSDVIPPPSRRDHATFIDRTGRFGALSRGSLLNWCRTWSSTCLESCSFSLQRPECIDKNSLRIEFCNVQHCDSRALREATCRRKLHRVRRRQKFALAAPQRQRRNFAVSRLLRWPRDYVTEKKEAAV